MRRKLYQPIGTICLLFSLLFLVSCDRDRETHSRGFHLPQGDIEVGKSLFVKFNCVQCHTVSGVDFADLKTREGAPPRINIGGEVYRVDSYGQLVTSIISPQHVVSPKYLAMLSKEEKEGGDASSPMPVFNEEMSVDELISLAAFLHSRYRLIEPTLDSYYYTTP